MSFFMQPKNMTGSQMIDKQHTCMIENPIPTWIKARIIVSWTIDANMIAEAIRKHFGCS